MSKPSIQPNYSDNPVAAQVPPLTERDFHYFQKLIYDASGVQIQAGRTDLVRHRLLSRLLELGIEDFTAYIRYIASPAGLDEMSTVVDALTTNETTFYRSAPHFQFLVRRFAGELTSGKRPLRIWSAGCSSGEEPYSIAIALSEGVMGLARRDVRILATDISKRMLEAAQRAEYDERAVQDLSADQKRRHFAVVAGRDTTRYLVQENITSMVNFAHLNLMTDWPMKGPFDAIFCRNVMIYFDSATRERLLRRFHQLLRPGGYLFIGHSESLDSLTHEYSYVVPAVYIKR